MAAFAPVMMVANQNSPFVNIAFQFKMDDFLINNFKEVLVFRPGSGLIADIFNEIGPKFV